MNREQFEEDLRRRQKEHLDRVTKIKIDNWTPCLHDTCTECIGTGIRHDGSMCIHMISCPCSKCNPYYISTGHINLLQTQYVNSVQTNYDTNTIILGKIY